MRRKQSFLKTRCGHQLISPETLVEWNKSSHIRPSNSYKVVGMRTTTTHPSQKELGILSNISHM